mgnify:CR=1 FL=1
MSRVALDSSMSGNSKNFSIIYAKEVYLGHGLSIIPLKPKSKEPAIESWKPYQGNRATEEEVEKWFRNTNNNIGIVCGAISGNLVVIDFDSKELYQKWYEFIDKEYPEIRDIILNTWVVKTSRGRHIYLRINADKKTFKEFFRTKPKLVEGVDIKGEGGYVVAPPSVHPSGVRYEFLIGPNDTTIAGVDVETFNKILESIREIGGEEKVSEKQANTIKQIGGFKVLTDLDLSKIKDLIKPCYRKGYRNQLCLFLSGYMAKAKVHPLQAVKVIKALHTETHDEEALANRCKPIVYSYAKAGYDLTQFREEMEKECGGSLSGWEATGGVKGITGIQEICEEILGENKALNILQELQDILKTASPYQDAVFEIMDYDKRLFVVANPRKKVVVRAQFVNDEYKEKEVIVDACPILVEVYENPIGGITKYRVVWVSNARTKTIGTGPDTAEGIVDYLRAEGLMKHRDLAYNYIPALLAGYIKKGKAIIKNELEKPGFYLSTDGKIVPSMIEVRKPNTDELKEALLLLNDLAERWFSHIKNKFALVIKWGIISPFGYVYKQKGLWIKWLYLYGTTATGKSTLGEIVLKIWGLDSKYIKTGASIDNIPRLGHVLAQGTFPILINETGPLITGKDDLIDTWKNAIDQKITRGAYRHGTYVDYPALAMLILTSNRVYPKDEALLRRLIVLHFTRDEKITPEKQRAFENEAKTKWNKLRAIGDFVAYTILNNNDLLQQDWEASAIKLLELAYREAGLDIPQWIYEKYESDDEDIEEDNKQRIREFMVNAFFTAYQTKIAKFTENEDPRVIVERVLRDGLIPWTVMVPKDGYNEVRFTIGLADELSDIIGDISLKQIASLLGWEYRVVKILGSSVRAIVVKEDDLLKFLFPQYYSDE